MLLDDCAIQISIKFQSNVCMVINSNYYQTGGSQSRMASFLCPGPQASTRQRRRRIRIPRRGFRLGWGHPRRSHRPVHDHIRRVSSFSVIPAHQRKEESEKGIFLQEFRQFYRTIVETWEKIFLSGFHPRYAWTLSLVVYVFSVWNLRPQVMWHWQMLETLDLWESAMEWYT